MPTFRAMTGTIACAIRAARKLGLTEAADRAESHFFIDYDGFDSFGYLHEGEWEILRDAILAATGGEVVWL